MQNIAISYFFTMIIYWSSTLTFVAIAFVFFVGTLSICSVIVLASSLFVIILNALTFMSFVSFGKYIFGDKTLQLPVHLFKLIKLI